MNKTVEYYQSSHPARKVLDYVDKHFGSGQAPGVKDLAAVDSFHLRGRAATVALAESVKLRPGLALLDVGAGPGGTARYLADSFGVTVTGLDLTHDFSRLSAVLSEKTRMTESNRFVCASALSMPFGEGTFDGVWMEHVQMNIPDKARLVAEIYRVLKPSGFWAMYEIFQTGDRQPAFPLPWAGDPAVSSLISPDVMRELAVSSGFGIARWHDCFEDIRRWLDKRASKPSVSERPAVGVQLLMGDRAMEKVQNLTAAVLDSRLAVIEAVFRKRG